MPINPLEQTSQGKLEQRLMALENAVAQLSRKGVKETTLAGNWHIQVAVNPETRDNMLILTSLAGDERILVPMGWEAGAKVRGDWEDALRRAQSAKEDGEPDQPE